jgi:alpha-L-fucosidase
LIDRYAPSVLWNDICWPGGGNLADLFAHYFNAVPDGAVNNRWRETNPNRGRLATGAIKVAGQVMQRGWRFIPEKRKQLTMPEPVFADFTTPEYAQYDTIVEKKWESTRGVGHSFGLKRNEPPEDVLSTTELVRSFCDIVSKNGNLLLGIGPDANGEIPEVQQVPLRGLGSWLAVNGEAIFGTRPWQVASGLTSEGTQVRFTCAGDAVFAMLTEMPGSRHVHIRNIDATGVTNLRLLGSDAPIDWQVDEAGRLQIELPVTLPVSPVQVIRIEPAGSLRAVK